MIKVNTLGKLLNFKDEELHGLTTEQLRLILGVLRFCTRMVQRELNLREPLVGNPKSK